MNITTLTSVFEAIAAKIAENKDYLVELDQQNGDGDLGISMNDGYSAAAKFLKTCEHTDLGMALNKAADVFNENAPSSLGTITAFAMQGMARALKGTTDTDLVTMANALLAGINNASSKAGSKRGEKTILDSLYPGAETLLLNADKEVVKATCLAALAAADGSEATKNMKAVWGRAAYFAETSIGVLDGGSVVGKLIFEAIAEWAKANEVA